MRQIKFRGKRKDGVWVFGDFFDTRHSTFCNYMPTIIEDGGAEPSDFHLVDPDTVSQFTGLVDRNGKEIYEGDVLEYDTGKRYVVVYSTEGLDSNTNDFYIGAFMLKDDHNFHELICSVTRPYRYAEIIGSIHDNPELLNEKQ